MFKKLHDKLDKILAVSLARTRIVEGKNDLIEMFKEEVTALRKQNADLLNRIMARDFEQLQIFTPVPGTDEFNLPDPSSFEELAGEVLEN